ncbi:hypothetical protein CHCC14821_1865 [Bacillus paralicheniformis]|nr:hypothetical protein CHCC14821_1865 [Bacillus paralicheniformis]
MFSFGNIELLSYRCYYSWKRFEKFIKMKKAVCFTRQLRFTNYQGYG